jgi:hypothetical protein
MQQTHVPSLSLRYWVALCLASIFGANSGDFHAHDVGLGHLAGLPFLALALTAIMIVERFDTFSHELHYWIAIVIVGTAATNFADFFSVDLRLAKIMGNSCTDDRSDPCGLAQLAISLVAPKGQQRRSDAFVAGGCALLVLYVCRWDSRDGHRRLLFARLASG